MEPQPLSDTDIDGQVEHAVASAQQVEGIKRQVLAELEKQGHDVEGGRFILAHRLPPRTTTD
jgi:hypothetical protein